MSNKTVHITNQASRPAIGRRETHYLEDKLSGMVVTESHKGAVVVPIVHVSDGPAYRERVNQIERESNRQIGSKFHGNNDRLKFPPRKNGAIQHLAAK